tara:strand:+ start:918 stop:1592 length:675 start_codon:yes stop_codon:yes gene_type:complete
MKNLEKLSVPFETTEVKWRVGSTRGDKSAGIALAYVDARVVMERLDDVLGTLNWEDQYTETAKGRVLCSISIKDGDGNWITKSDGAGSTTFEGEKGAISDAFKRAAVKWGIGRYLYSIANTWVKLEKNNIAKSEFPRLYKLLPNNAAPAEKKETVKPIPKKKTTSLKDISWWQDDMKKFEHLGHAEAWKKNNSSKIKAMKNENEEAFNQLVADYKIFEGKYKPK